MEWRLDRVAGVELLLEAFELSRDVPRSAWDFAIEVGERQAAGLSSSALRWLACKEYVECAIETSLPADERRSFGPHGPLVLEPRMCFVLTESGARFVRQLIAEFASRKLHSCEVGRSIGLVGVLRPRWDALQQELWLGDDLVKRFTAPAPNQEVVLAAFEEEGRPQRIDDPLTPQPEQDTKRRLLDTLKCLNRHQHNAVSRFHGDGTGQGVRWEALVESTRQCPAEPGEFLVKSRVVAK